MVLLSTNGPFDSAYKEMFVQRNNLDIRTGYEFPMRVNKVGRRIGSAYGVSKLLE